MSLPKLELPYYQATLPISKKKINYRPFTVKEEKILLQAVEEEESRKLDSAVQIIANCLREDIDIDKLPTTDIELLFLLIRARSVSEIVPISFQCECENKTINHAEVNLLELDVTTPKKDETTIKINDQVSIKYKYPDLKTMKEMTGDRSYEESIKLICCCLETLWIGEETFSAKDEPLSELIDFVETSFTKKDFEKFDSFFESIPTVSANVTYKCTGCQKEITKKIEGFDSFFV